MCCQEHEAYSYLHIMWHDVHMTWCSHGSLSVAKMARCTLQRSSTLYHSMSTVLIQGAISITWQYLQVLHWGFFRFRVQMQKASGTSEAEPTDLCINTPVKWLMCFGVVDNFSSQQTTGQRNKAAFACLIPCDLHQFPTILLTHKHVTF